MGQAQTERAFKTYTPGWWLIFQVQKSLSFPVEDIAQPVSTIIAFLIQEGASISAKNKEGYTPLQLCEPPVAALLKSFSKRSVEYFVNTNFAVMDY